MKVIAQGGHRVVVQLEERDPERPLRLVLGCVVDMRVGKVYRPRGFDSIIAHGNGYWYPFEGDPEPVLARVWAAIEGGLLTPKQLKHIARERHGLPGGDVPIDQLSPHFVATYAEWLGVTYDEAYMLLEAEPARDITDEVTAAGSDEA